jgi:hypothetical protein
MVYLDGHKWEWALFVPGQVRFVGIFFFFSSFLFLALGWFSLRRVAVLAQVYKPSLLSQSV